MNTHGQATGCGSLGCGSLLLPGLLVLLIILLF